MAAGNNIQISLNLDDTQFKNGIKRVGQQLQSLNNVKKLKIDVDADIAPFQQALKDALSYAKKAGALSYTAKNGKAVEVSNVKDAISAYKRYIELADKTSNGNEQNAYLRKANAVGAYIQALSNLGNKLKETEMLEKRLDRARDTGRVNAERRNAEREALAPEREAKAADRRFRNKQMEGLRQNDKAEREAVKTAEQKAKSIVRDYDTSIKNRTDVSSGLFGLKSQYNNGNTALTAFAGFDKRIAGIKAQIANLKKTPLFDQVECSKSVRQIKSLQKELQHLVETKSRLTAPNEKELLSAQSYANKQTAKYYQQQDRYMNRMSSGKGNSTFELSRLRDYYREQERLSAAQAKAAQKHEEAVRKANVQLEKQSGLLGRLKNLAGSYLSVFAAFRYIKSLVDVTGFFEQQQVALEGILGSASAATKAIGQLKQMALQSPKQFKDLVGDAKQLSAYGIEVEKLLPTVKQLADISVGLGVDMGRLTLAYGQVKSATVLRGQELRQFTEAGVPMVEKLAEKFTDLNGRLVTTGEVFDLISKRQVSFEMVAEVLRDMTAEGGKFYNMQENISETLYGQVQKIKDLWTINLADTGSGISGVLMAGVKAIQLLIKESRTLLWIFGTAGIMVGIKSLVTGFGTIKRRLEEIRLTTALWKMELRSANGFAGKAGIAFKGIGMALKSNIGIAIISALVGVIARAAIKAGELRKEFEKIDTSFAKDNAKYVQGFDSLIGKLSTLTEGTKKYNEALDTLKSNYSDYVNPAIIDQLIAERKQLDDTAEGWGRLHDSIVAAINAKNDYEQHKAKKEKAGDFVAENAKKLNEIFKATTVASSTGVVYTYAPPINSSKAANQAYDFALDSFLSAGETEENKLKQRLQQSAIQYGLSNEQTNFLMDNFSEIWKSVERTTGWADYLNEHKALENTDEVKIDKAFQDAQERTAKRQEGRWKEGMSNEEYNPTKLIQAGQFELSKALRGLVIDASKRVNEMLSNGTSKNDVFAAGAEGVSAYNAAIQELNGEIKKMSVSDFQDAEKVNRIAQALHNLMATIKDPNLLQYLSAIQGKFNEMAGVKTGRAAQVSNNITRDFLNSGVYDHETKDWYARYVKMTNDETIDSVREGIRKQYQENQSKIDSYSKNPIGENKKEIERLEKDQERLRILAGREYYDIDLTKKTSGGGYKRNKEYDEFLNEFKSAYEMYKKAVQQGGLSMGAAFVQNNKKVQEMFGGFFNGGEFGDKFKQLKVGDKNIIDLIQDKFIKDGVEKGIVDFKGAAEAVAAELKANADKYKGTSKGQDYLQSYNSIMKWIESTFSKDNLDGFLDDLTKSLEDLTLTFEKTNQGVELYRKLIQQGTQDTLGKMLDPAYASVATDPESLRMAANVARVVEEYNQALEKEAASNPDSEIAKSKNGEGLYAGFSIGSIANLNDAYKELQHINDLIEVNNENFKSSEAGKITVSVLKPMLEKLIQKMVAELASVSGRKYTGNAATDIASNALIDYEAARSGNETAQKNAREVAKNAREYLHRNSYKLSTKEYEEREKKLPNGIDYAALQQFIGKSQGSSTAIFDQFLKDNDFSVMFDSLDKMKHINFDDMRAKLEKVAEDFPPLLKQQLLNNLTDLEQKTKDFNTSTGGRLFANIRDYRTAGDRAQTAYNEQVQLGKDIAGDKFAMIGNQISLDGITDPDTIAQLMVVNQQLDKMGENGEKLERDFKKDALKGISDSAQLLSRNFNAMTDVVNAVSGALKAFVGTLNKVYDVMNDGENPDWMVAMEEDVNDWADSFESLIAPIVAVIAVIGSLAAAAIALDIAFTPLLIAMGVIIALAAVIAGVVAAFQHYDNESERSIERMKKEVNEFDNAITNLNAAAERQVGLERLQTRIDAVGLSLSKASEYANMAAAEDAKKNTDEDKLEEYKQQQQQFMDEFVNSLKSMADEITASTDDWASNMGNAIRSAFQNGGNAARAFRNTVKDMIGDVVENMLEMAILQPMIEEAMESWTNQDALRQKYSYTDEKGIQHLDSENYIKELLKNIGDPAKAEDFYKQMLTIGNTLIDVENGLPEFLQDALWNNSDLQSLSGGIESITEDTARRLEALGNSQLGALLNIQSILQNYVGGNGMYGSSPMADIQTSMAVIQSDTTGIRVATQTLLSELKALRSSSVQPLHVTLV